MNRKQLFVFLALELFAIVWAGVMFSTLNSKVFAGALAGGYFVVSGITMLALANKWPDKWKSLTWYMLFIHVFAISLPMLISRFLQVQSSFEEVRILGLPGPAFHNVSSTVFSMLIAATVGDLLRTWKAAQSPE